MSDWAGLGRINSDLSGETLDFTSAISDISVFGMKSYAMQPMNAALWDRMSLQSVVLYGHGEIHEYVYERLTEKNIDAMYRRSGKLGRQLNSFHNTERYAPGGAEEVFRHMAQRDFQALDGKFQPGYRRYADYRLSAPDCGKWLNDTFELGSTALAEKTTLESIYAEEALMTLLSGSEAAMTALTAGPGAMDKLAASETAFGVILQNITLMANDPVIWHSAVDNLDLMARIYADTEAMTAVAESVPAMWAIIQSENAMTMLMETAGAMTVVANTQTAMNTICAAYIDVGNAMSALERIKSHLGSVRTDLPKLVGSSAAMDSMTQAQADIDAALAVLEPVVDTATRVQTAMNALAASQTAMNALAASQTAMNTLAASQTAMNVLVASQTAMNALAASQTAMNALVASQTAMNVVYASDMAITKCLLSLIGGPFTSYASIVGVLAVPSLRLGLYNNASKVTQHIANSPLVLTAMRNSAQFAKNQGAMSKDEVTFYNAKAFLLRVRTVTTTNIAYTESWGKFIGGASTIARTCNTAFAAVNRFASAVTVSCTAGGWNAEYELFKI